MTQKTILRVVLIVALACIAFAFWWFDLGRFLSLDYMREIQGSIKDVYARHSTLVLLAFGVCYTVATALSFPGAGIMTVAAGGFFGLFKGVIVVSFASTIGACLAFILARTLLRDWVVKRFGEKLTAVNEGVEKEGDFYLFSLRLIPIFPFFMINVLMALTKMPLRTFGGVSQLGMLPGTIVFVNAGRELAKIDSLAGILSPSLIFSFCLMGILPLVMKKLIVFYKAKKNSQNKDK